MQTPNIRFTLRQLQFFAAAARTGKISLAALECHVTQSTMTAAISELERALGTLLFERGRNGVALTHEGHLFLQRAGPVLEAATEAALHPFREQDAVSGTLRIAASYTVLGYYLLPLLARFQKQNPGVRIIPMEYARADLEAAVERGDVDIALALTSNMTDLGRFAVHPLARSRRQLWASATHPLVDFAAVTLADVAPYPYILPMVDEGNLAAMRYWRGAGLEPSAFLQTSSMEAVREMVALGLGVTILSDMVFRPWSLDGRRIRAIPLADAIPLMEVGLIWRRDQPLPPAAEALRGYLHVAAGAQPQG